MTSDGNAPSKTTNSSNPVEQTSDVNEVKVRFARDVGWRKINADGAWFAFGPRERVALSFYHDTPALPTSAIIPVKNGVSETEPVAIMPEGVDLDRTVQIEVTMGIDEAEAFCMTLQANLKAYRDLKKTGAEKK